VQRLRIFLADDHAVLLDGLSCLINGQHDMEVVGRASDGCEIVQRVNTCRSDVVVMDVSMPGVGGVCATAQLHEQCPQVHVIALTRHDEPGYIRQMLQAGAHAYVLKQACADELINAIRSVAVGSIYLDSTLTGQAVFAFVQSRTQSRLNLDRDLSKREADVARLLAYGYSNKEIATQLGLSVKTVDTYKARAMEKLGLHSRASIVRYALHSGWLDEE
jgi:DNA-binding NarL/FixJ family response regulator